MGFIRLRSRVQIPPPQRISRLTVQLEALSRPYRPRDTAASTDAALPVPGCPTGRPGSCAIQTWPRRQSSSFERGYRVMTHRLLAGVKATARVHGYRCRVDTPTLAWPPTARGPALVHSVTGCQLARRPGRVASYRRPTSINQRATNSPPESLGCRRVEGVSAFTDQPMWGHDAATSTVPACTIPAQILDLHRNRQRSAHLPEP